MKIILIIIVTIFISPFITKGNDDVDISGSEVEWHIQEIRKFLEYPDSLESFLKNPIYDSESISITIRSYGIDFFPDMIRNLKILNHNCVLFSEYSVYDPLTYYYRLRYIGDNTKDTNFYSMFYVFSKQDDKLELHCYPGTGGSLITSDPKYFNLNYNSKGKVDINLENKNFYNEDYQTSRKIDFLEGMLKCKSNIKEYIQQSEFYSNKVIDSLSLDSLTIFLDNYLRCIDYIGYVHMNYPFPVDDGYTKISEYMNNTPKDYFICAVPFDYSKLPLHRRKTGARLTVVFIKYNNKWVLERAFEGYDVYIGYTEYEYMRPRLNKPKK